MTDTITFNTQENKDEKKLSISIVVSILMSMLTAIPVFAVEVASGICGENVTWSFDSNGTLTISGSGDIQSFANGDLGGPSFIDYIEEIEKVVIESGVTSLGWGCLDGSTNLKTVYIPDTLVSTALDSFANCPSIEEFIVDENNPAFCSVDGTMFTKDMTELKYYARGKADSVYKIPAGVKYVGFWAFRDCPNLTEVIIPEGVIGISDAFLNCPQITSMTLPSSLAAVGYHSPIFADCDSLENIYVDDANTEFCSVDGVLFSKDKTTLLRYPQGKTDKLYQISEGVTTIGKQAFYGCTNLTEITIPASMAEIEYSAFYDCGKLDTVYYNGTRQEFTDISNYDIFDDVKILYNGTVSNYYTPTSGTCGENLTWELDSEGTLTISGTGEMVDCLYSAPWDNLRYQIKKIIINPGMTKISRWAFSDFYHLTSVTIPDSVTDIGELAFYCCVRLESITLPDNIIDLYGTFANCYSLTNVVLPQNLTKLTGVFGTFRACKGLENINMPSSVTHIDDYTFADCTSLEKITIPDGVTLIGSNAFMNCKNLSTINIPDSVTSIGSYAFSGCYGLATLLIPASVTTLGNYIVDWPSILIGTPGSYVETYASESGTSFSPIITVNVNGNNIDFDQVPFAKEGRTLVPLSSCVSIRTRFGCVFLRHCIVKILANASALAPFLPRIDAKTQHRKFFEPKSR